jgi:hypothetical protein
MLFDDIHVDGSPDQRVEWFVGRAWIDDEEPAIAEIADTGNEPVTEGVEHGKRRFGRAGGIGCMLPGFDGAFFMKEAVEYVGRFAFGCLDHAGEEGGEAVGQEDIDRRTRSFAVFCIVFEAGFAAPAGRKELPVRGRDMSVARDYGEGMGLLRIDQHGGRRRVGIADADLPSASSGGS